MALTKNSQIDLNGNEMILDADGDTSITADTDDQIDFKTAGSDRVIIDSSGKVGIGAAPTLGALHVTSSLTDIVTFENTDAGTTGAQLILYHNSSSPADGDRVGALNFKGQDDAGNDATYAGIRCLATDVSNTTEDGTLTFSTTRAGTFTEAMRIDESGNVGIGTTSPSRQVHLNNASDHGIMAITGSTSSLAGVVFGDTSDDDVSSIIHNNSSNYLYLTTSSTERMRIDSAGAVMFHTTTALGATTSLAGTNTNNFTGKTTTDTYSNFLGFASGGNITYYVTGQGNYFYNGSAVSDRDLKENIEAISESSLAKVKLLEPKTFNFKADDNFGTNKKTGFIAQEVAAIFGTTDGVATGTDGQKDMGIDPTGLIAHLTKAIQEQQVIIDDLKARITTLEGS